TIGDFNLDGKPDLVIVNGNNATASILRNTGGAFAAKVDFQTGSSPRAVAVADFNNDGKPDLATANFNDNSVSLLRNNGLGGFLPKVDFLTGNKPQSI